MISPYYPKVHCDKCESAEEGKSQYQIKTKVAPCQQHYIHLWANDIYVYKLITRHKNTWRVYFVTGSEKSAY